MLPQRITSKWAPNIIAVLICVFLGAPAHADKVTKDLKEALKARYKRQKVRVLRPGIIVGLVNTPGNKLSYPVHYDHFHPSVEMPKKYQKRNAIDERTTEQVQAHAPLEGMRTFIDQMAAGEILRVQVFSVWRRSRKFYAVDLYLVALAQKRLATYTRPDLPLTGHTPKKINYGVHFRFAFAPEIVEKGDYDTIVNEINEYLLPEDEYREQLIASQEAAHKAREAGKQVEIQPGMSKEEIIEALGEPLKTIVFGNKTILKYQDITVELEDNKVVEVKAN